MDHREESSEFLPPELRKGRKFTQEDAIYGVWAQHDEDEDVKTKKKHNKPMSFVEEKKQEVKETYSGLGSKRSRTAHASVPVWSSWDYGSQPEETQPQVSEEPDQPHEDVRAAMGFAGFGALQQPLKRVRVEEREEPEALEAYAHIEKHTRGIGSKLMAKMGFDGRLGKRKQGISRPIEVKVRPKNLGLAAGGTERTGEGQEEFDRLARIARGEIDEEEEEAEEKTPGWQKRPNNVDRSVDRPLKHRKPKVTYTEATAETAQHNTEIVDMRGPQTRIVQAKNLSDASGRRAEYVGARRNLPELQYNTTLLLQMSTAEVGRLAKKTEFEKSKLSELQHEVARRSDIVTKATAKRKELSEVCGIVRNFTLKLEEDAMTLDDLYMVFWALKGKYKDQWKNFKLDSLAIPVIFPKFQELANAWEPLLADDAIGSVLIEQLGKWNNVFCDSNVYISLLRTALLPPLRTTVTNRWDPHDPDTLVDLCKAIRSKLPDYVLEHMYDHLIVPQIIRSVDDWNPKVSAVKRIDLWIHPWLEILGDDRLRVVYPSIRQKIAQSLNSSWKDAMTIVEKWKRVFTQDEWNQFMKTAVIPRITSYLKGFKVNPAQQLGIKEFKAMFEWSKLIRQSDLVVPYVNVFFPQFQKVLYNWLKQETLNSEEVIKWYSGWKAMFPPEWKSERLFAEQFARVLRMINQYSTTGSVSMPSREKSTVKEVAHKITDEKSSFKDEVEAAASQAETEFLPLNKVHDGHQLFSLNGGIVYLGRDAFGEPCLYRQGGTQWHRATLEESVE